MIATPVPTHAPLARMALEADKDVFVEKPLALTGDATRTSWRRSPTPADAC